MNAEEARIHLAQAERHQAADRPQEAEALFSSVISGLPRNGEAQQELAEAYEGLLGLQAKRGHIARVMRLFRRYVGDCAPPCDESFDHIYYEGLLATKMPPVPLIRRQRFHALVRLFRETLPLEGLVAECGCFRGLSSYLLCSTLKAADDAFAGQGYRIFDSFKGLSEPQPEDAVASADPEAERIQSMAQPGRFAATLDHVKAALGAFPRIEFFPGWIPAAFPAGSTDRYRFVHVDVDLHQPTRDSLEYFFPRLVAGGILVCDDYNWPGARRAIEEFCARSGTPFRTTPHQQAWIVRGA